MQPKSDTLKLIGILIVILIMIFVSIRAWTYEPLTDEEIEAYWMNLDKKERIEEIRKLDIIENAIPEFNLELIAIITNNGDLIISQKNNQIMTIGPLSYDIELSYKFDNFLPNEGKDWMGPIIFCSLSAIAGTAITGEDIWWKYLISLFIGGLLGWSYTYIFR